MKTMLALYLWLLQSIGAPLPPEFAAWLDSQVESTAAPAPPPPNHDNRRHADVAGTISNGF